MALFAEAGRYWVLVVAIAIRGVAQALANPATNKLIASYVPVSRRGLVVGIKQSGVQLGAFAARLPLAALAGGLGWRAAVWTAAASALLTMFASGLLPRDPPVRRAVRSSGPVDPTVWWLMGFQALLGAGTVAVNTYVALFATQDLGFGPRVAAALVAVMGIAGIAGRLGWSWLVANGRPAGKVLVPLGLGGLGMAARDPENGAGIVSTLDTPAGPRRTGPLPAHRSGVVLTSPNGCRRCPASP